MTVSNEELLREMLAVAAMVEQTSRDMGDILSEARLINLKAQEGRDRINAIRDRSAH